MRAFVLLIVSVTLPVVMGIAGYWIGTGVGSDAVAAVISAGGFLLGCIPVVMLWRRTPRTGYPTHDDGDAGFWASGGASGGGDVDGSGD